MKFRTIIFGLLIFLGSTENCFCQIRGNIRIMFYNVENLFDIEDDPQTQDNDYTPTGKQHWTNEKYSHKLFNIFKTIAGVGGWVPPEIIGLSEIENHKVLMDLLHKTPLVNYPYGIAHFESPDPRGIDVALLYRTDKVRLLDQQTIPVFFKNSPSLKTRDILMVKLTLKEDCSDTLYLFVNHWPSRRGGEIESEESRIEVADQLKNKTDSLFLRNPLSKIIILGDFNDEPDNISISQHLQAQTSYKQPVASGLYNLITGCISAQTPGTHKFRGQWNVFDQIIVSGELLLSTRCLYARPSNVHIYDGDFLFQPDIKNLGKKLLPTFTGPQYIGGFSDHLPVYMDLFIHKYF